MTSSDTQAQDAIDVLIADHREVEQLFTQIESGDAGKDEAVRKVIRELSIHAAIEEQVLYPVMRRALADGDAKVDEAIKEHQEAKEALAAIEQLGDSPPRDQKLQELMEGVRHHVEEEETELFPEMRSAVSEDELRQLGAALVAAKKMAPTHPHPNAPATPPGNVVAGVAAAGVDRARDALRDN